MFTPYIKMPLDTISTQTKTIQRAENDQNLTKRPLLIQTPLCKAVHQPDLVVLVTTPPGRLEDLNACRQPYVVFVVVTPGS